MLQDAVLNQDEIDALAETMDGQSPRAPKVLLVEGAQKTLGELVELLRQEGIAYLIAENLQKAREALRANKDIDLMITDLRICNEGSGLDLIRQVRDSGMALMPVILVSGEAGVEDAIEAMRLHVVDFFLAPLDLPQLLAVMRAELGI
ncbi:response regulator [Pseudomonas cavernicola]|uniref:Response regulator n=1 Tax=Pseudomonas cavernicola TaxID=2320866 RepID=A0A418XD47_9PSED|nr:response regulator [Pseudomonas cavernicola]RJG10451.1 response regulator [Pseudomonas cavernicola]